MSPRQLLPLAIGLGGFLSLCGGALAQVGPAVVVGQPVQFLDLSTQLPTTWSWDFDYDGSQPPDPANVDSSEQNPVVIFNEARPYQVLLEACNLLGCTTSVKMVVVERVTIFSDGFESGDVSAWKGFEMPP